MTEMVQGEGWTIYNDDVTKWAASYDGPPFMAMFCDPPYHLTDVQDTGNFGNGGFGNRSQEKKAARKGFMGKSWDGGGVAFRPETWAALAAHLLPGAFLFAFGGTRTYHRMAVAIEDAGLVMHPALVWANGAGFPKATRIDTQVDKAAGAEREVIYKPIAYPDSDCWSVPNKNSSTSPGKNGIYGHYDEVTANGMRKDSLPATPLAAIWEGHRYGRQALKPAAEFICVAQVPYDGRPVDSITRTGAGSLWIDGGRIEYQSDTDFQGALGGNSGSASRRVYDAGLKARPQEENISRNGRWPANLILSEDAARRMDEQSGERPVSGAARLGKPAGGAGRSMGSGFLNGTTRGETPLHNDTGGASRYFMTVSDAIDAADPLYYCAKASTFERSVGVEGRNPHPCLKPLSLTEYICRLLLPPAAYAPRRILCPFGGVFSEAIGAMLAGFEEIVVIEREKEYVEIGTARMRYWQTKKRETGSSDPRSILKTCGKKNKEKQGSPEHWLSESLFGMSLAE